MKQIVVYPGTFDPLTNGHLGVIKRGLNIFDKVIVVVASNSSKNPLFNAQERVDMIREVVEGLENVEVDQFDGLLVDYARKRGAKVILRGLRSVTDFDYEFQMANINKKIAPDIETLFMMTEEEYFFINSIHVREVAYFGGNVSKLVPVCVERRLKEKVKQIKMNNCNE